MGWAGNISALIERFSVLLPAKIISISSHTSKQLREQLHYKKEIALVSAGLDIHQIKRVKPSALQSDIIYTGRLLKHKRVDLIIHAVAKLRSSGTILKCIIVGNGPEKDSLRALAKQLGVIDIVQFHDFYEDHDDVYALIKSSKVFVFPSEREGFGIVVIEANACGKPVVVNTASTNAARDLVRHNRNGFTYNEGADELVQALKKALKKTETVKKDCLKCAEQYDWDSLSTRLAEVYAS